MYKTGQRKIKIEMEMQNFRSAKAMSTCKIDKSTQVKTGWTKCQNEQNCMFIFSAIICTGKYKTEWSSTQQVWDSVAQHKTAND